MKFKERINQLRDKLFTTIHSNNLIYNTCWEDPRVDRKLLKFNTDSNIVMITSAGCNALDYLLDDPKNIHCIDMNQRQNALLEFKKALFQSGDFDTLFQFFGTGKHKAAIDIYEQVLRPELSNEAQIFWDQKIDYFTGNAKKKKSFYYRGTSGQFAWVFNRYLDSRPKTKKLVNELLHAETIDEQRLIYHKLEPKLLPKIVRWAINRQTTMTLLGVPRSQTEMITTEFQGGVAEYLANSLKHIFTEIPISDNYFWYVYLKGYYSHTCSPSYLQASNFTTIKSRLDRVNLHTSTIADFLEHNPGQYSHFILLDHQDWLAANNQAELEREWDLILKHSAPGSKFLLRSAHINPTFIPQFVLEQCTSEMELVNEFKDYDRVGTYASTILLTRK